MENKIIIIYWWNVPDNLGRKYLLSSFYDTQNTAEYEYSWYYIVLDQL